MPNPFFTAITGLSANQAALGVIGNNIANSNTVAFKSGRAQFADLISQQFANSVNGAGQALQIGLGARMSGVSTSFEQGALQLTGSGTNAAIVGNGLFVLRGADGIRYSRAGNFLLSQDGYLMNPDGLKVQGYTQLNANGGIVSSGALSDLQIPIGITSPPTATTSVTLNANLDASTKSGAVYDVESQVFDSLGGAHTLAIEFTRNASGNSWDYTTKLDGNAVTPATTGTVTFDANGSISVPGPDAAGSPLTTLTIPGQTLGSGAATSVIKFQLVGADGTANFTGFDAPSATTAIKQNGSTSGVLTGIAIGADGIISGSFSNGQTQTLAQIATAAFNNYEGLTHEGSNLFAETVGSGQANIGAPGTASRGALTGNSIESSNVDLPTEFSNMILAQRGFQANSRVITTTDQVLQDIMNIIR